MLIPSGMSCLILCCSALSVDASPRCRVPLSEWQPREVLQAKLRAMGVTVLSIRADNGCYKVKIKYVAGDQSSLYLNPNTLESASEAEAGEAEDED